jgi:hypothetical protein
MDGMLFWSKIQPIETSCEELVYFLCSINHSLNQTQLIFGIILDPRGH